MDNDYLLQLSQRVAFLEMRVTSLESRILDKSSPQPSVALRNQDTAPVVKQDNEKPNESVRARSIRLMQEPLHEHGLTYEGARSSNKRIRNKAGITLPVYISTSSNYSESDGSVRSWNTIRKHYIDDDRYAVFIVSVEDHEKPTYFVFTREEMRKLASDSNMDKNGIVHFYFGWDSSDGKTWSYPRSRDLDQQSLDQYKDAWEKLNQIS
jgi:hypothetical protein